MVLDELKSTEGEVKQSPEQLAAREVTDLPKEVGDNSDLQDLPAELDDLAGREACNKNVESKEDGDVNEGPELRELKEAEKAVLKGVGLSDSNIEKCSVDEESGKYYLNCRNQGFENGKHPETNVPYVRKEIVVDDVTVVGVFPVFECVASCELPETLRKAPEKPQFSYLNRQLYQEVLSNPEIRLQFTDQQVEILAKGKNPPGFTWHHNEECGKMQLVSTETHAKSAHTGGDSLWCGR